MKKLSLLITSIVSLFCFNASASISERSDKNSSQELDNKKIDNRINIMKRKISFKRDGLTLIGNLFTPNNFNENGRYSAIIVEGSLTSVKEQMPETYAQKFANEGFVVLAFDYSHYRESEGKPRQLESPENKLKDLEAAVSYLTSFPYVKSVGMVGVCTSAGNATYLAAHDPRIKALATVAGYLPDPSLLSSLFGQEKIATRHEAAAVAKKKFEESGEETVITTYSETDPTAANFAPTAGSYDYYLNPKRGNIPEYKNELSVISWETFQDFNPISRASAITAPTMVVHSDGCAFPDQAKKFYSLLQGEKELVWADGIHYDYYDQPVQINTAVTNITKFFNQHLEK